MIQKAPIFVTGIQRSGSTMIAKILEQSGVFCGRVNSTMVHLKSSFLLNTLFCKNNWDKKGQYPLPNKEDFPVMQHRFFERLENMIGYEGYKSDQAWMLKGHRLMQTWKIWLNKYPDAKWIIVRRRSGDVVNSCMKTAYMNRFEDPTILRNIGKETAPDGWLWWIHKNEEFLNELIRNKVNYMVVWPERMAQGDYQQIQELHNWLGLPFKEQNIKDLIQPMMEHSKQKGKKVW